jgi:hypothetical protein
MRKKVIGVLIFILLLTNIGFSYAFWASHIIGDSIDSDAHLAIGTWPSHLDIPNGIGLYDPDKTYQAGDLVWYDGNIYVVKYNPSIAPSEQTDTNGPYNMISIIYQPINTYQAGDVVFYNGSFYEVLNGGWASGTIPGSNGGWKILNQNAWVLGQPYVMGDIVYYEGGLYKNTSYWTDNTEPTIDFNWVRLGDYTWNPQVNYLASDIVLRNGTYYRAKWNNSNTDPLTSGQYGAWETLVVPIWSRSISGRTQFTLHQGILYRALVTSQGQLRNNEPGRQGSQNVWQAMETEQWLQFKTYSLGDLVIYQGQAYRLVNTANSTLAPGSAYNAWNLIGSANYAWYNVYQNGDHVIYNDEYYVVVNQNNANNHVLPGSILNAWNNLTTFNWYFYNQYQVGSIVVFEHQVYRATAITTNHQPGTPIGENYWFTYIH